MAATDTISASDNGGLDHPKAVALSGDQLFVADWGNDRVLRFTGPFNTPDKVYDATATFGGLGNPVDLTVDSNHTLWVDDQVSASGRTRLASFAKATTSSGAPHPGHVLDAHAPSGLGLAADATGRLFIADYAAFRIVIRRVT